MYSEIQPNDEIIDIPSNSSILQESYPSPNVYIPTQCFQWCIKKFDECLF